MRKLLWILLSLFLVSLIPIVYADEPTDVDIISVPQKVGEALGVPEPNTAPVGGLLLTCILLLTFVMPTMFLKNKAPAVVMIMIVIFFCSSVGWIAGWVSIMVILLVAGIFATQLKKVFS